MSDGAIGIDIGGTNVKLGYVDASGGILMRRRFPYSQFTTFEELATALAEAARTMVSDGHPSPPALGIAAPGHATLESGVMVDGTSNVPLLRGRSLSVALRDRLGWPVTTINDGTAAALGELRFGAGRGLDRFAVITLGTGVGGGVVIARRVITGSEGEPPEIGAMVLDAEAGAAGTFEALACARGFIEAYARAGGAPAAEPDQIFMRAAAGDPTADQALGDVSRRIAQACGSMINLLNLEACLIGGGISQAGEALRSRIERHLASFTWPYLLARSRVAIAQTGQDAGMLGAAARALEIASR